MPTLFDKVDQFWRGVGEQNNDSENRSRFTASSRPPLPPSVKSKNVPFSGSVSSKSLKNKCNEKSAGGRPPAQMSYPVTDSTLHGSGKFDRNRRCYSSLALNGNKSSKHKLASMGGSIVDIYEFCKSQASRRFNYQSNGGGSSLKSKGKQCPFSGSTKSVCGYPCIKEEVMSTEIQDKNYNEGATDQFSFNNRLEHTKDAIPPVISNDVCSYNDGDKSSEREEAERNVIQDQWARDGLVFDRLTDCENACPTEETLTPAIDEEEEDSSQEPLKMRWNKLGSTPSTSASFSSDRRPKSFDYAQRKAWMKLYRDMEVSQAGSSSSGPRVSRPISKGSITHLHLQDQSSSTDHLASCSNLDETGDCRCDYESDGASMSTMMRSSADISETSPSLFKRFSKTFSLRFGSGSNVSKQAGDVHRKSKTKGAIGSSPDLYRVDADGSRDKVNGKMRKTNVKSARGDKCQSGDSGIGIEDQQTEARHVSNLRRIRSDYISSSTLSASPVAAAHASRQHANTSALAKLSLVEIPDHSWDENNGSPNEGSGTSNTASYEDLVDAKLDGDDGFSSSDEGQHLEHVENPTYYHTLPHRKHNKRRLKETDSANSCGGEVPQEDNSIRGKVVREIIHTEQNYVKTLNDIVQGFLNPCRARNDLFSSRTVQNIFSNIEDILRLHVKFLEALKSKLDPTYVSKSNVGGVFTTWADKFSLYSEYCCNNPISVATVRSLVQFPQYAEFFEACRRLQMMDKLPLHGFLLRPIQRICQYHLQLNELLKHTEESHTDHQSVVEALETMKSVANKINDTQRQFESLQELIRFQNSIDGWEGPNLVDRNSVILRKGELVKVTHGRKHKEVFVAILNKDLIYCKKDFMKKSGYVFDGRIDLNLRMWINIDSNEEDEFFGMVHNSWRIYSPERRAWILFTAPSPTEKRKWISALEKTKEEVVVDPKLREMAVVTTALADSEMMGGVGYQGHHSNTLPKSSKKSKSKNPLSVTKVDSDAMLIEVGKLKRSTVYPNANNIPSGREGTSKFYV